MSDGTDNGSGRLDRAWWKKKRFLLPAGAFVGLAGVGALVGEPEEEAAPVDTATVDVANETIATSGPASDPPTSATPATVLTSITSMSTTPTTTTTTSSSTTALATTTTTTSTIPQAVAGARGDLATLMVADPDLSREPYERDRYDGDGWLDVDGDCLSTRHELLAGYSLVEPTLSSDGCRVENGVWVDPFDGSEYTSETEVSIDHLVPLSEAHRSGAWKWDDETKERFVNDETAGHLLVVGRDTNQAKADKRPDEWLPPDPAAHCQYAIDWVTTKSRYALTITATEQETLDVALGTCAASTPVRPVVDAATPDVVVTTPSTTTTTTIAPTAGPGVVELLSCNRRSETVTIGNTGGEPISLSGFTLHDEGDKHRTGLGGFGSLSPGEQLRILTGPEAANGPGQVVWKNQNVWNNDGDIAFLLGFGVEQTETC